MSARLFNPKACSECGMSFQGAEIPEKDRHLYAPDTTHFGLCVGIYDQQRDMTVQWACPDCGARWDRFTEELVT